MTNVPNDLRDLWADVYRLFDKNYLMKNDKETWDNFWHQAQEIYEKYNKPPQLISMVEAVADLIGARMKLDSERQNAEKGN